jgi:hypothetical protein
VDLNHRQTRGIFLVGKVAFPTPFPSIGTLSFESGMLSYAKGEPRRPTKFVIVQQPSSGDKSVLRAILQRRVAAMFVPGRWSGGKFRISRKKCIEDWDNGEWFLDKDVSAQKVMRRLKLSKSDDITSRDSILRGIVFVGENQPVVNITEVITLARHPIKVGRPPCTCECCCEHYCTCCCCCCCEHYCTCCCCCEPYYTRCCCC